MLVMNHLANNEQLNMRSAIGCRVVQTQGVDYHDGNYQEPYVYSRGTVTKCRVSHGHTKYVICFDDQVEEDDDWSLQDVQAGNDLFNTLDMLFNNAETKHLKERVAVDYDKRIRFGLVVRCLGDGFWEVEYDDHKIVNNRLSSGDVGMASKLFRSLKASHQTALDEYDN
jgi:hypothetical protein